MHKILLQLALDAGQEIMRIYSDPKGFGVEHKIDNSPVTEADQAADALISSGLREAFPEIPVVTEEQASSHQISTERFFLVDPLDGTKEFIKRRGDFTVNIALIERAIPICGVVYAPAHKRLFYGDSGGALEISASGERRRIRVAAQHGEPVRVVASKSHRDPETDAFIAKFDVSEVKGAGSSLKFCLVASGEADLYPRFGRTMEWDTAAGHALVLAAGGEVIRADTLEPLTYGKKGYENPPFIVKNHVVKVD